VNIFGILYAVLMLILGALVLYDIVDRARD